MNKATVPVVFGYLWVVIKFPGTDLNFWTQIPKALHLETHWHGGRNDEPTVSAPAVAKTMTLTVCVRSSNTVLMKCESRGTVVS